MSLRSALRIAGRELRGGLSGFRIFLACIALGVASIAIVGSIKTAIQNGLTQEATTILGGDAQAEFTYRKASPDELAWMHSNAEQVSETLQFRSMAVKKNDRALVQVKAVDDLYPLYGDITLDPEIPLAKALASNGFIAERALVERLSLKIGDKITIGTNTFTLNAILTHEPDNASAGFAFGPKIILLTESLKDSGLLEPGALFDSAYRLKLPPQTDLPNLQSDAESRFTTTGLRWTDRRNAAPGIERFVRRMGSFLTLVGLAGLAVGGIGVVAAVRSYLDRKTDTIATLKTLGATGNTIFTVYFTLITLMGTLGVAIGLALGAAIPAFLGPLLASKLPVPALFAVYPRPILEAALYGTLAMFAFALWPLARTRNIKASGLFRAQTSKANWPRWPYIVATFFIAAALVASAAFLTDMPTLTLWFAAGIIASLFILRLNARLTRFLAARLATKLTQSRPALRLALRSIAGPGGEANSVILSLGLGLTVLATIGQVDANLQNVMRSELPAVAPAFFVLDIQQDQIEPFTQITAADPEVSKTETTPMLRGILTRINNLPAEDYVGHSHWTLDGDRGVTYSATPPTGTILTAGTWWPENYTGEPQVSFATEEATELGLKLGDMITLNVLGRDITAKITSFRVVEFRDMGINFLMVMNPAALQAAPHTSIATIYAEPAAEGRLLRNVAGEFPNITMISVREGIASAAKNLASLAAATRWGALATLLTGFIVLIGTAAVTERSRTYEAAILKTTGADRTTILVSFALRSAIAGAAAGAVAIATAALAGWAIVTFEMESTYTFQGGSAVAIVALGTFASLIAGLLYTWRPLATRPASVLRGQD